MRSMWERTLQAWAARVREQANLPVCLCWGADGAHRLALGDGVQPAVLIRVRDPRALRLLVNPSLQTLGQAYVEGLIDVEGPLEAVLQAARRLAETAGPAGGVPERRPQRAIHSRQSDRAAIAYHYDLSNAFYAQWLDPAMVYSCAYFARGDESLAQAQTQKIDHILRKIRLQPGQRLLDVGCGWGALVLRAAQRFGARCVGVTLSQNQFELATERVRAAGLQGQVEIRLQDYRDVCDGPFDRITSVGMFEHVGLNHLADYFARLRALLVPEGWMLNHGITSTDENDGEVALGAGAFIGRYVFPQGELPHIGTVLRTLQAGGLEAFDVENLRRHYAQTLRCWSQAYESGAERIRPLVSEQQWRIWRVYLAGCAWAFESDQVSLYQVLCRPAGRSADELPWSRGWLYA